MQRKKLLRYTNLPVLLHVLSNRKLTLLNPAYWDDRNDSYYIELYKKKKKLKSVLALCFTTKTETYHHWKVFSDGSSGVCIQFKKDKLLEYFQRIRGIESDYVFYSLISKLQSEPPDIDQLPFLKRQPYRDECEFRIIYKNKSKEIETKSIGFGLECIEKINLSPWLPGPVSDTVKSVIKDIPGCSNIRVSKTTLIESKIWKNIVTKGLA